MRPIIFLAISIFIFTALAAPFSAQAVWVPGQPIVPCINDCDFNGLIRLVNNIIDFLIYLAVLVAVAMFAYAGWLYLTSAGDTGKMKEAHTIFTNAGFGFIFVLGAWLIITLILKTLVGTGSLRTLLEKIFGPL